MATGYGPGALGDEMSFSFNTMVSAHTKSRRYES
jgi:hypothetical protein